MSKTTIAQRDKARAKLRELLPKGTTVYVNERHLSRSGMLRRVSVHIIDYDDGARGAYLRDVTMLVGQAADFTMSTSGAWELTLRGAGMDMHFHLVYSLASVLYGDGYALTKESI